MTDKELRKLRRQDLLEILVSQEREIQRLQQELDAAREALDQRHILLAQAGSIAEAALQLNGVFAAAQQAADQYLESIQALAVQQTDGGRG